MSDRFRDEDKIKCLLWCDRHCCLCGKACGTNIVIHHIIPKGKDGTNDIDNAIPLCFDCHGEVEKYNDEHAVGSKYKQLELKPRRDQIYEKYTQHLVPFVWFNIQKSIFPDVGIVIKNQGTYHPVRVSVAVQVSLGGEDKGLISLDQYNGKRYWNLNPQFEAYGHFTIPDDITTSTEEIEISVSCKIIDKYDRTHELLPLNWIYRRNEKDWYLEPRGIKYLLNLKLIQDSKDSVGQD